jgi:RecA-family ATPase
LIKRPVTGNEILATDFKCSPPVLTRGILPAGAGLILAGDSGVGKSLMRLEWAILLAAGLEIYDFSPTSSQCVLIFQAENTIAQEQLRMRKMLRGLEMERCPDQLYYAPPVWPANIKNKSYMEYVLEMIHQVRATVAIFDPLISYHSENENDNVKMRTVLDAFTHVSRHTGASIMLIHHFGKPSDFYPGNEYRMRGAQAIRDWADTAITITPVKSMEGRYYAYRKLDFIKIRSGPFHAPITLKRNEFFLHELSEDVEQSPEAMLGELVKTRGMTIHSLAELVEVFVSVSDLPKGKAKEVVEAEIGHQRITESIEHGMRGFKV